MRIVFKVATNDGLVLNDWPCNFRRRGIQCHRNKNLKLAPYARLAFNLNKATMLFDDAVNCSKSQPGP